MVIASAVFRKRLGDLLCVGAGGAVCFCSIGLYNNDATLHRYLTMPLLHLLDPETSHRASIWALKHNMVVQRKTAPPQELESCIMGLPFSTPLGLAAGYDKEGEAVEGLSRLGFGFIEVGSVTPQPQEGNPKPRVFRLKEDKAVINRYGFNSAGHEAVLSHLRQLPPKGQRRALVGVNLGKNKTSTDSTKDYRDGVRLLGPLADYLVINVSSPNTPGLRGLQSGGALGELLTGVQEERGRLPHPLPPILVKIAPDLTDQELRDICQVSLSNQVSGLIVSNTTLSRPPGLASPHRGEIGGLSGRPMEDLSTRAIRSVAGYTRGRLAIIGVGGVADGAGAYAKLRAGASAVQLYTALVYAGPGLVQDLEQQLVQCIRKDGYKNISEIIGLDIEKS